MKAKNNLFILIILVISAISCKKAQIVDDSPCPNCPRIDSLEPAQAQPGDSITIIGQRFGMDKSKISIEIQTLPNKTIILPSAIGSVTDTKIRLVTPISGSGFGKIVVKLNIGSEILATDDPGINNPSENQTFGFISKAKLTTSGIIKGKIGDEITIAGINFGNKKEDAKLEIGDVKNISASFINDTELKFEIPENVPSIGTMPIRIFIKNYLVQGSINFEYNFPEITSTELTAAKDQIINIVGRYFGTNAGKVKVMIGNKQIPITNIGIVTETQIPIKIPAGSKDGIVTVKIYEKNAITRSPILFSYAYTYNVRTFKYSLTNTLPIEIKDTKGRKSIATLEDNVVDFKVLKSTNVNTTDNIYLARLIPNPSQSTTYNSAISTIGGKNISIEGVTLKNFSITPLKSPNYTIKWIVPFNSRFLFSYKSNASLSTSYISEFIINGNTPLVAIGENFRSQNFQKVAYDKATLNRLFTYTTNSQETIIYHLTRENEIGAILKSQTESFSKTNLIKNCIDIELFDENIFLIESGTGKIWRFNLATKSYTELLKGINTDMKAYDITIDQDGIMYALDKSKSTVYSITNILEGTQKVKHIVGNKDIPGYTDGVGLNSKFQAPTFITNTGKTVYVYDGGNMNSNGISLIRYFTPTE